MKNNSIYSILWVAIFVIGILLLSFMVAYEGEPGAIPLILIISGASGYLIRKFKIKSATK